MTDKTVFLAGVAVSNGKGKFHTSGEKGAAAQFIQLPVPMVSKPGQPVSGSFAFVLFNEPVTKLEAAERLLTDPQFLGDEFQATLKAVIAKRTPVVKAPKAPKEERKAKAAAAFKDAGDMTQDPTVAKNARVAQADLIRQIAAKRSKKN